MLQKILAGNNGEISGLDSIPLIFETPLNHVYSGNSHTWLRMWTPLREPLRYRPKLTIRIIELHDGMYVQIRLPISTDPKAVIVKDAALSTDQLGTFLYVVNDSDRVVYTPVKTGELGPG